MGWREARGPRNRPICRYKKTTIVSEGCKEGEKRAEGKGKNGKVGC